MHSRGNHAEPTRPKREVGGCHYYKCNKYYSDKKKNKNITNHYAKLGLRIILPPFTILFLPVFFMGELDDLFQGLSELFYGIVFFLTFLYFAILKPLEKLSNKILSR